MAPSFQEKVAKYVGMAAGFAQPHIDNFVGSRKKVEELKEEVKRLSGENSRLAKENNSLKQQLFISGIIAAFALILFIIISIVHFVK